MVQRSKTMVGVAQMEERVPVEHEAAGSYPVAHPKFHIVYRTTHVKTGAEYIGSHSTGCIEDGYLGSGLHLKRAIEKHGRAAFVREVLFVFKTPEEMLAKEREMVTVEYCARADTYNVAVGGGDSWHHVNSTGRNGAFVRSKESATAAARAGGEAYRERVRTDPELRARRVANSKLVCAAHLPSWVGRKHSEETRAKQSAWARARLAIRNPHIGRKWVTKDGESRKVEPSELPELLAGGWRLGRA